MLTIKNTVSTESSDIFQMLQEIAGDDGTFTTTVIDIGDEFLISDKKVLSSLDALKMLGMLEYQSDDGWLIKGKLAAQELQTDTCLQMAV